MRNSFRFIHVFLSQYFYYIRCFIFMFLSFHFSCFSFCLCFSLEFSCTDYLTLESRAIYDICSGTICMVYGIWYGQIMSQPYLLVFSRSVGRGSVYSERERGRGRGSYILPMNNRRTTFSIVFRTELKEL